MSVMVRFFACAAMCISGQATAVNATEVNEQHDGDLAETDVLVKTDTAITIPLSVESVSEIEDSLNRVFASDEFENLLNTSLEFAAIELADIELPLLLAQNDLTDAEREELEREIERASEEIRRASEEMTRMQMQLMQGNHEFEAEMIEARAELERAAREIAGLSEQITSVYMPNFMGQRKAMLGITLGPDDDNGIEIIGVTPGGPAEQAGLAAGDILRSFDGQTLVAADQPASSGEVIDSLMAFMNDVEPEQQVTLGFERDGVGQSATVTAAAIEFPYFDMSFNFGDLDPDVDANVYRFVIPNGPNGEDGKRLLDRRGPWAFGWRSLDNGLGEMEMVALTPDLGRYFGADEGVLVVRAPENNEILQLRDGDVLLRIDDRVPESPHHALRILSLYKGGEYVELEIMRDHSPMTLQVQFPETRSGAHLWKSRAPLVMRFSDTGFGV